MLARGARKGTSEPLCGNPEIDALHTDWYGNIHQCKPLVSKRQELLVGAAWNPCRTSLRLAPSPCSHKRGIGKVTVDRSRKPCGRDQGQPLLALQICFHRFFPLKCYGLPTNPMEQPVEPAAKPTASPYSRNNPFLAELTGHERLTKPESEKDTRHFVLNLADSGITYTPGDSLGAFAQNSPVRRGRTTSDFCASTQSEKWGNTRGQIDSASRRPPPGIHHQSR